MQSMGFAGAQPILRPVTACRSEPRSAKTPVRSRRWSVAVALMPVADALAAILEGSQPMPEEMVALEASFHRVLARDIAAQRTQPPQAMSAMDGYAVRAGDAAQVNAKLRVIGEVAAGRPFDRAIGKGEAARIFTGGVIPDGADSVVIQEDTVASGDGIAVTEAAVTGRH